MAARGEPTFQITATFASLTVLQNVQVARLSHRRRTFVMHRPAAAEEAEAARQGLERVGLGDHADRTAAALAYGDQKKLELAVALASDPVVLLLDEPTAGMAPAERGALMALVARLARERALTVLFTEHDMDAVFAVAERITVLHQGRVIASGAPAEVRADPEVQRVPASTSGREPRRGWPAIAGAPHPVSWEARWAGRRRSWPDRGVSERGRARPGAVGAGVEAAGPRARCWA